MTSIPAVVPPLPRAERWKRHLPDAPRFEWLAAGWRDFVDQPASEPQLRLAGLPGLGRRSSAACSHSAGTTSCFPAFAGFMVVGPILAVGLYEKSRRIAAGEPVELARHDLRQAAIGRPDPVHRRPALPADAAVDACGRHHLRAVLRPAAVSRASITSRRCCSPRRSAGRC